jgi:flagellar biosynthesis protein FlhG
MSVTPSPTLERSRAPHDDQATRLRAMVEEMTRPAPPRPTTPPVPAPPRTTGPRAKVLTISSGKGGVGKTNLSVNLAIALTAIGRRTTLLDADLGLANADLLCGITPTKRLDKFVGACGEQHADLSPRRGPISDLAIDAPGGFKLVPGAAGVSHMADLAPQEQARLLAGVAELERIADVLIIDTAAGLGRDVLSMVRIADMAIVVATPEPTSIADAYALIKCVTMAARDRGAHGLRQEPGGLGLRLLVNQAIDQKEATAVHARIAGVCGKFLSCHVPLLGWVPRDDRVSDAVRKRRPLLIEHPRSPASRAIHALAAAADRELRPAVAGPSRKPEGLSDLLSRLVLRGR